METVGVFEAKVHLSRLVERASRGETILITRHGKPVARLTAAEPAAPRITVDQAVANLRAIRERSKPGPPSIREMIEEGRM